MTRRQAEKRGWTFTVNDGGEVHQEGDMFQRSSAVVKASKRRDTDHALEVGAAATLAKAQAKCLAAIEKTEARWARRPASPKPIIREGSLAAWPGKKGGVA